MWGGCGRRQRGRRRNTRAGACGIPPPSFRPERRTRVAEKSLGLIYLAMQCRASGRWRGQSGGNERSPHPHPHRPRTSSGVDGGVRPPALPPGCRDTIADRVPPGTSPHPPRHTARRPPPLKRRRYRKAHSSPDACGRLQGHPSGIGGRDRTERRPCGATLESMPGAFRALTGIDIGDKNRCVKEKSEIIGIFFGIRPNARTRSAHPSVAALAPD